MELLLIALAVLLSGAVAALLFNGSQRSANLCGCATAICGTAIGLVPAARVLQRGGADDFRLPWNVPYGSFSIQIDGLSAFFLVVVFLVCGLAALYGSQYVPALRSQRSLGMSWFFFNLMVAAMALVIVARNVMLFLVAWEVMSLASFFLVTQENEDQRVCEAGKTYLVATHVGTAFLFVFFVLLVQPRHSGAAPASQLLDFDLIQQPAPSMAGILFVLALVGFGTKAGFMPLHIWSPQVYPVAPHHVTACMSGAMSKLGIYGLICALTLLGAPCALVGLDGDCRGRGLGRAGHPFCQRPARPQTIAGLQQRGKRGNHRTRIGHGLVGCERRKPMAGHARICGCATARCQPRPVQNAAILGAGSVEYSTGTRNIDELGGLLKRIPWTSAAFLVGAMAICGLPPLNGFVSEYLIYLGAFGEGTELGAELGVPALAVLAGLALTGGLAAACFTKAFGIVFLGEPRSEAALTTRQTSRLMRVPLMLLAAGCFLAAALSPAILVRLQPAISQLAPGLLKPAVVRKELGLAIEHLSLILSACGVLLGLIVALAFMRKVLLAGRVVGQTGTWDCGYSRPTTRIQYTGSSFAQPITNLFGLFLRTRFGLVGPSGLFPKKASLATETRDVCEHAIYRPAFSTVGWALSKLRWLQHGRIHMYVMYIAITLIFLLIWYLGPL